MNIGGGQSGEGPQKGKMQSLYQEILFSARCSLNQVTPEPPISFNQRIKIPGASPLPLVDFLVLRKRGISTAILQQSELMVFM